MNLNLDDILEVSSSDSEELPPPPRSSYFQRLQQEHTYPLVVNDPNMYTNSYGANNSSYEAKPKALDLKPAALKFSSKPDLSR